MQTQRFKALIVDDDLIASRTVGMALGQESFNCSYAVDGEAAMTRVRDEEFDLVVTDLRMPKRNGHALAIELLALDKPPVIVVHSCVDNPRLAKDLMAHGVDDIIYKPTNYKAFAAKIAALVQRRFDEAQSLPFEKDEETEGAVDSATSRKTADPSPSKLDQKTKRERPVTQAEYDQCLANVQHLIPLSAAATEVFGLVNNNETTTAKLAATLSQDAALTTDILRLANCAFYNRSNRTTTILEEAISRIGFRKVGEAAMALSALQAFRGSLLPWIDADLEQTRSLAATIALAHLAENAAPEVVDGLALCTFLHPLGRLILGSAFRDQYQVMVRRCGEQNLSLVDLERQQFPESHTAALGRLLSQWNIPQAIWQPICHVEDSYSSVEELDPKLRRRVEVIKLAIFIGNIAVGRWMSWDQIEPPPPHVLMQHSIDDLLAGIERTRQGLQRFSETQQTLSTVMNSYGRPVSDEGGRVAYVDVPGKCRDWLPDLLASLQVQTTSEGTTGGSSGNVLLNGLNAPHSKLVDMLGIPEMKSKSPHLLFTGQLPSEIKGDHPGLDLPASVAALRAFCLRVAAD